MTNVSLQPIVSKMSLKYIGSSDNLRIRGRFPGEICTCEGVQYVWVGNTWESFEYEPSIPKMIKPMFCSQCGASLHGNICEYCGTAYR